MTANAIFINYRRSLSLKDARLLQKALEHSLGLKQVFLDVDGVGGGDHWLHTLERQVDASAAMVVLIGEGWIGALNDKGQRRIDDPNDFVRFEIGRALSRGIPVLPALIDGAEMPPLAQFPQALAPLTFLQAMPLRMRSFDEDADKIGRRLRFLIEQARPRGPRPWQVGALAALALALGVISIPLLNRLGMPMPLLEPRTSQAQITELRAQVADHERVVQELRNAWETVRGSSPEAEKRNPGAFLSLNRLLFGMFHVANLRFLDADAKTPIPGDEAELIDAAIEKGVKAVSSSNGKYVFKASSVTLENNEENSGKLGSVFFHENMPRHAKIEQIIAGLMNPSSLDGLIAGLYKKHPDGSIELRPLVFSKATKDYATESRNFKADEFYCRDSHDGNRKVLCAKAADDIRDTVGRLLKHYGPIF